MSSRTKRKLEAFDPNASDPDDSDYDNTERRGTPQRRRRHRSAPGSKKKGSKRQRRIYNGSDVDNDDDEIVSDDSFTERSSSEEIEINPSTGRSVRQAAKKEIKYEESEEDEIEDTPSEDDSPPPRRARSERKSLIVKLTMPKEGLRRATHSRAASKSVGRGKTPDVGITRRSSRLSHDQEDPIVALSDSGKHVNIVRAGSREPEQMPARATRGGKGPRNPQHSIIMEASQEASMVRDDDDDDDEGGPLDDIVGEETQVKASHESSPEHEAQIQNDDDAEDDGMEGVIQESQHEGVAEESDEEEGPITRGGRNLRVSIPESRIQTTMLILRRLERPQASESEAQTRAATSSLLPRKKRKTKKCPSQMDQRAASTHLTIVVRAQVVVQLAFGPRRGNLGGPGATQTFLNKTLC
jgi:hypothetical protein